MVRAYYSVRNYELQAEGDRWGSLVISYTIQTPGLCLIPPPHLPNNLAWGLRCWLLVVFGRISFPYRCELASLLFPVVYRNRQNLSEHLHYHRGPALRPLPCYSMALVAKGYRVVPQRLAVDPSSSSGSGGRHGFRHLHLKEHRGVFKAPGSRTAGKQGVFAKGRTLFVGNVDDQGV